MIIPGCDTAAVNIFLPRAIYMCNLVALSKTNESGELLERFRSIVGAFYAFSQTSDGENVILLARKAGITKSLLGALVTLSSLQVDPSVCDRSDETRRPRPSTLAFLWSYNMLLSSLDTFGDAESEAIHFLDVPGSVAAVLAATKLACTATLGNQPLDASDILNSHGTAGAGFQVLSFCTVESESLALQLVDANCSGKDAVALLKLVFDSRQQTDAVRHIDSDFRTVVAVFNFMRYIMCKRDDRSSVFLEHQASFRRACAYDSGIAKEITRLYTLV